MKTDTRRGARSGRPDTKSEILKTARELFHRNGYNEVSLREIAAVAKVDVALVSYYFGSKQGVFFASMELPKNPVSTLTAALDGDRSELARRLLTDLVETWDDPQMGPSFKAMLLAANSDSAIRRAFSEAIGHELIEMLGKSLKGPKAKERAAGFSAAFVGVIFSRYLLEVEPMASLPAKAVIDTLSPALQLLIDGR
jgi:AcrR family transcriptional regulator